MGNSTLLARGDLAGLLTPIAGTMLMAAAILPVATAWLSAVPGQVTTTQEISVVALAAVLGATSAAFAGGGHDLLATILVTIGLTTTLCGIAMWALGRFGLGRITRFVPYPIFAGFLAITGWYLITGGLETIVGGHLSPSRFAEFAAPETALKLVLVALFVGAVEVLNRRFPSGAVLPICVLVAMIGYNLAVLALGLPRAAMQDAGWIMQVPESGLGWPPVGMGELLAIDWAAVGAGLVFAPFVVVITAAGAMMNVSGIELDSGKDLDLNVELRAMGVGNVAAGLVGGIPGFPAVSATMLALKSGAAYRATGLVSGVFAFGALLFAPLVLGMVPLPLLGGLLIWVGVSLIIDWLIRPAKTLRRSEYAIIVIMLGVSIVAGLPAGIGTGLVAALVLFAVEYARVDGLRFVASGRDLHSRSITQERRSRMAEKGEALAVIKLAGFLFFGTSDRIVQRIVAQASARQDSGPWYAILDFSRVTGLDSSTILSFERLRRMAGRDGFEVVFAGLDSHAAQLAQAGLDLTAPPFHRQESLESALRWVEDQILGAEAQAPAQMSAHAALGQLLGDEALAHAIVPYLTRIDFAANERIIEQGSAADDIYFIESGRGAVVLESNGSMVDVLDFGPGTVLGEVSFYGTESRSASVVARQAGTAWALTTSAIAQVEREQPSAAAAFHRALARVLSERLQSANRLIRALSD